MTLNSQRVDKWKSWLDKIQSDVTWALSEREVFDKFVNVYNDNLDHINNHHGETFCSSIRTWYAFFSGFAVRRQVDRSTDRHNISLRRLLEDVLAVADQFTYEFYLTLFPLDRTKPIHWQEDTFQRFSEDCEKLSSAKLDTDIQELDDIRNSAAGFIDRAWAHLDKRGVNSSPGSEVFTYGLERPAPPAPPPKADETKNKADKESSHAE